MSTSPPTKEYTPSTNGHSPAHAEQLSIDELERRRVELLDQIRGIEGQLSDPDRRDSTGQRLTGRDYWKWRKNARFAWQVKVHEYRSLGLQIKALKSQSRVKTAYSLGEPEQLLDELHRMVKRWLAEGVATPRPAEQELMDRVAARLGKRDPDAIRLTIVEDRAWA